MPNQSWRVGWRGVTSGALVLFLALAAAGQPDVPPPTPPPAPAPPIPTTEPQAEPDAASEPDPFTEDPAEGANAEDLPAEPSEVTVFLKDGQRFSGLLVEQTPERLVLRIEGIQTRFPAAAVDRVRTMRPIMERYHEMRSAMGDDPSQIAKLADWLRAREQHDLALSEVERALRIAPDNVEARQLRILIAKQIELRERARPSMQAGDAAPDPTVVGGGAPPNEHQLNFPLLTPEQISLMKVYEVDLARAPRMLIRRETITKLIENYRTHPLIPPTQEGREAIYRRPPREVLELMFRVQARELYPEVQIIDQPESIRAFRDQVHRTWLINSCATNMCHGGQDAGRLMLSNRRPNAEASVYTNLLIMERFQLADGTTLLNYENPERSPLLQLALPRGDAVYQHPEVPSGATGVDGWKPVFRSTDDRRFQQAMDWMKSMYRPRPEYPIDYAPPGPSQPTAPLAAPVPR